MRDLKRQLGFVGACVLGLGSIMGTGVYVSLGLGAGLVGPGVLAALFVGLLIAVVNGMNSAQLAAVWPRSGGTYEYGYHFLSPVWGFSAGVLFLVAKSASAATAALGFAGYLHGVLDWTGFGPTWTAGVFVLVLGGIALVGLKPAFRVTALLVGISLVCLLVFVGAGLVHLDPAKLQPFFRSAGRPLTMFETVRNLGEASALMFVAYTGYGRIATLGEEVTEPRRTIPRAVLVTLALSFLIYALTALVALMVGGAEYLAGSTAKSFAPLAGIARLMGSPWVAAMISLSAAVALAGVTLNLILGLSRIVLAMARRRDLPPQLAFVGRSGESPYPAVAAVTLLVLGFAIFGDVKFTWSFSAFFVLIYYAVTNLASLRIPDQERLYPRALGYAGLVVCLLLAMQIELSAWMYGAAIVTALVVFKLWRERS